MTESSERAAGARTIFAPAARRTALRPYRSTRTLDITMNRAALRTVVVSLTALGIIAFTAVLVSSWGPSRLAENIGIVVDEPRPPQGTYVTRDFDDVRLLIVAAPSGELSAFVLPLRDGKVMLPDLHWWRMGYICTDFRPESTDGTITNGSIFECHDAQRSEWSRISWRWTIDGKNLRGAGDMTVDDFNRVDLVERQGRIRIHRQDIRW